MFECDKCYKLFKYSYLLNNHNKNKMLCNIPKKIIKNLKFKIAQIEKHLIDNDNKSLESKKICYYCEKNFTTKHNLMRHLYDRCYEKKKIIDDKNNYENIVKQKEKELKKDNIHKQELKKCKNANKNIININNGSITNNNNNNMNLILNNNVHVNSFGREDLSHITEEKYKKYIKDLFPGILNFIKDVHFSPDKPENHNICIPKLNSSTIAVYQNGKWNAEKKISTIKDLLCAKIITLDNKFYNYEDNDLLNQIEINEYNDCIAHCFNDDNKKNIYQDVELLLYNNRKTVDNYNNLLEL